MPERLVRALAGLVLAMLGATVAADDRWYQIEVVGFRYLHAPRGEEPGQAGGPDYSSAQPLTLADPKAPPPAVPMPVAFQMLARNEQQLEGVYKQLARGGAYKPLIHAAWRQAADAQRYVYLTSEPPPAPGAPPPVTNGARFDGMEGKILVRPGDAARVELDFAGYQDGTPSRLTETRTIRLNELHYFDDPDLGVLVQVTAYEPNPGAGPTEATAAPLNPMPVKPGAAPEAAAPPPGSAPAAAPIPAKPGRGKVPALVITPAKPPANAPKPAAATPVGGTDDYGAGPSD